MCGSKNRQVFRPEFFDFIHGEIGLFHQVVDERGIAFEQRDPDACRAAMANVAKLVSLIESIQTLSRRPSSTDAPRPLSSFGPISTTTTTNSSPPRRATVSISRKQVYQAPGNLLQQQVAGVMPVRIIERLEFIHIDQHQPTVIARTGTGGQGLF